VTDDNVKLYVDATRLATMNDGVGSQTNFATLEAAVVAWRALPTDVKIRGTVKVIGGPVYRANQIDRFYYGPKPDTANEKPSQIEFANGRRGHGGPRSRVL
jgi:hypothetical protein